MDKKTPVYILSGFLGSGKTTLLQRLLGYWQEQDLRPAVLMNEIGDVNLDGTLVPGEVPMAEMLGGCICCSIRGDLSLQMSQLITEERPDLVVIEATGAGNPLEIFDAVAETALYLKLDIKPMITVVDSVHLADLHAAQKGKTYRLMLEQIRCGSMLIMNKVDLLGPEREQEIKDFLKRLNPFAEIVPAVKCEIDLKGLLNDTAANSSFQIHRSAADHNHCGQAHSHIHASHEHVTVYTHYFEGPVNSRDFEQFIAELPREIYRGKGILSFSDTASRFLFQYAYREPDYLKIDPQGEVPDVAVFIGEHFDKDIIARQLNELEHKADWNQP